MIQREFFDSFYIQILISFVFFLFVNGVLFIAIWKGRILKKKNFQKVAFLFNGLFILIALIFYFFYKPYNIEQRIVFTPTDISGTSLDSIYSIGFVEQIEHNLINTYQQEYIVHSQWWTLKTILDKKNQFEKIAEISKNIPNAHVFSSRLAVGSNGFVFNLQNENFEKSYEFKNINDFKNISITIINDLHDFFNIEQLESVRDYFDTKYWNARLDFINGRYDKIIKDYDTLELNDRNTNLVLLAGLSYLEKTLEIEALENKEDPISKITYPKEFNKAKFKLYQIFTNDNRNKDIYLPLIRIFLAEKDYEEAEDLIKVFLTEFGEKRRLRKSHSDIYFYYSFLHPSRYKVDGFTSDLDLLTESLSINPFNEKALLAYSEKMFILTRRVKRDENSLVSDLKHYLEINPYHTEIKMNLANYYLRSSKYKEAYTIFQEFYSLHPDASSASYNMGIFYYRVALNLEYGITLPFLDVEMKQEKLFNIAKSYFTHAVSIDKHLNSYLYLGRIAEHENNMDEAIKHYRYRIKNRVSDNDEYYKEARKGLRLIFKNDTSLYKKYLINEGRAIETKS